MGKMNLKVSKEVAKKATMQVMNNSERGCGHDDFLLRMGRYVTEEEIEERKKKIYGFRIDLSKYQD